MKYFVILILVGFTVIVFVNVAYGMWFPQSPEDLFEQSETVFVGTVTSVNVLEFERSNTYHIEENGVFRIEIENYTQTLDEYAVNIEEFLKNPQTSNIITMLEATVGGVPGRSVSIGGFELGDRVLFYVPKIDGTNQYSPESFKIPKQCDAKSVLEQPKISGANDFKMMQDGILLNDNFTADKPIQFVYNKDMRTLEGESFDVDIIINKIIDKNNKQIIVQENIHTESKPCEWVSSASWEFVPPAGKYSMLMHTSQGNSTGGETSSRNFTVIENISEPDSNQSQIENIDGMLYYVSESFMPNSSVDKIMFYDVEFSPPYRYDPPRYVYSDVTFSDGAKETLRVLFAYTIFSEHVKPQTGLIETHDGIRFLVSVDLKELSPLKQIKSGISIHEIQCREDLVKVIKKSSNMPACVQSESKSKLIQRDWIKFKFSFCGADGFNSKGNLNKTNSTHYWDENECDWEYVGPATNSINKWSGDVPENDKWCNTELIVKTKEKIGRELLKSILLDEIAKFGAVYDVSDRSILLTDIGENKTKISMDGSWRLKQDRPDIVKALTELILVDDVEEYHGRLLVVSCQ